MNAEPSLIETILEPQSSIDPKFENFLTLQSKDTVIDLLKLPFADAKREFERLYLSVQIERCDGKVRKLARIVDLERTHLYRKLRDLGVDWKPQEKTEG